MVTPISSQVPTALQSFIRRYQQLQQLGGGSDLLDPLQQLNYNRAIRGAYPIPLNRTQDIVRALQTRQTGFEKKPRGGPIGLLERAGEDIGMIARSLPRLPGALVNEVKALPQAPAQIQQALASKDKLDVFKAPGLRLLPGAYVASEGLHTFGEHPVLATLDVAPYAKAAGEAVLPAVLSSIEATDAGKAALLNYDLFRQSLPISREARGTSRLFAQEKRQAIKYAQEAIETTGQPLTAKSQAAFERAAKAERDVEVNRLYGTPRDELVQNVMPLAERKARAWGVTPEEAANQIIDRFYGEHGKSGKLVRTGDVYEEVPMMVPKQVNHVLNTYERSPANPLNKAYQKSMSVFRTSVLPLHPQWQINNAISGAILTGARTGPSVLRDIPEAFRMVREGRIPEKISSGWGSLPAATQDEIASRGALLKRIIPQALGETADKWLARLWGANGAVDNFYRSLAYTYGARKGGEEAGITLANKVLQDWDAMVPFERSVIKTIFPFYGWVKHMAKYASTYPIDHPLRAAFTANLARAEIADWGSGLPQNFMNYFYLGPDSHGNQKGLSLRGANPFSDTDALFHMYGLVSQLNPLAGGLAQAAGLNPMTGRPDLYQDVEYDPQSGRLVAKQPSVPSALANLPWNYIPQLKVARQQGLLGFLGVHPTTAEKQLKLSSPESYRSMILGELGIPSPKTVNKKLETAAAEYRAGVAMQQVWANALRSGDFSEAERYPRLRPLIKRVRELQKSGALKSFEIRQTPEGQQDPSQLLRSLSGGG